MKYKNGMRMLILCLSAGIFLSGCFGGSRKEFTVLTSFSQDKMTSPQWVEAGDISVTGKQTFGIGISYLGYPRDWDLGGEARIYFDTGLDDYSIRNDAGAALTGAPGVMDMYAGWAAHFEADCNGEVEFFAGFQMLEWSVYAMDDDTQPEYYYDATGVSVGARYRLYFGKRGGDLKNTGMIYAFEPEARILIPFDAYVDYSGAFDEEADVSEASHFFLKAGFLFRWSEYRTMKFGVYHMQTRFGSAEFSTSAIGPAKFSATGVFLDFVF